MTYAPEKFEAAMHYCLEEDIVIWKVMEGQVDGQTMDRLWLKNNIPHFSYKKAGITILLTGPPPHFLICACPVSYSQQFPLAQSMDS